jgi:hypothetical protein
MLRKFLVTSFFLFLYCFAASVYAATRCECPSVKAYGEGNSSCSASESNGQCSVDFNVFAEREARAYEFLQSLDLPTNSFADLSNLDPNLSVVDALELAKAGGNQRAASTVLLFVLVAASAGEDAVQRRGAARQVGVAILENVDQVTAAFQYRDVGQIPEQNSGDFREFKVDSVRGYIGPGCIELNVDGLWVMFKTFWSPLRSNPRCHN